MRGRLKDIQRGEREGEREDVSHGGESQRVYYSISTSCDQREVMGL